MIERIKKDIHNQKGRFKIGLTNLENDPQIIPHNKQLIIKFIRDCRLGKTIKNKQKKIVGEGRCLLYLYNLRKISFWMNKHFDAVSQQDMELLIENIENNSYTNKPLSHTTKVGYKKSLRKFYKWLLGNNKHYPELVDWIDTYDVMKEIPAITREEADRITDTLQVRDKAIFMFLFDSGARAEELLNIRIQDITKNDDIYKVRIVFSKTKRRTIHLPICSKYVKQWLQEYKTKDDQAFLFPIGYDTLRKKIRLFGDKVLQRRITPHMLRHSSVTYYANLLNHHQLCYRYGWSMASDMPNRYIDREGIIEKETTEIVKAHDLSSLEKQNAILKEEISMIKEANNQLSNQQSELQKQLNNIQDGRDFLKLIHNIINK